MDTCKIVTDLLPSYCDGLTSWETNTYIKTHLNECPNCSRLLESMQRRQMPDEADARREQFRASLARYEFAHKLRVGIIVGILALLAAAFFIVRACSLQIALDDFYMCKVVVEPVSDDNGDIFAIYSAYTGDMDLALIKVRKNDWGFWYKDYASTSEDNPSEYVSLSWPEWFWSYGTGLGVNVKDESRISHTDHYIYYGQNARRLMAYIPMEKLPDHVYVQILSQSGKTYCLHVYVSDYAAEASCDFDMMEFLRENGFAY